MGLASKYFLIVFNFIKIKIKWLKDNIRPVGLYITPSLANVWGLSPRGILALSPRFSLEKGVGSPLLSNAN